MPPERFICGSSDITYDLGYICLWLKDFPIPPTFQIDEETLLKKDHFHVSLLCVKNVLEVKPELEEEIINCFCDFKKDNKFKFVGFTNEFRTASDEERKSVVALCEVLNLHKFADYLSEKIGLHIPHQPAHVTLYTRQQNIAIGLNSPEEMALKSKPIMLSEAITSVLF